MVVSFNRFREAEPPVLTLCNPYCFYDSATNGLTNPVGVIAGANDINIRYNFNAPSELTFSVNKPNNPNTLAIFSGIQNRRLVFAEGVGFYYLTEVTTTESDDGVQKQVTAQSCEIDLMRKIVPYIDPETAYSLSACLDFVREEFPEWNLPSDAEDTTNPIPETIVGKERIFEELDDDINMYAFIMQELQKAFGCVFEFNYMTRTMTCYDASTYVGESLAYIPGDGLANSISITRTSEDVRTALTVRGENDLIISGVNPLGTNTVYDFSYFYDQMDEAFAQKVEGWQQAIADAEENYRGLGNQYAAALDDIEFYEAAITQYDMLAHVYQMCVDNVIAGTEAYLSSEETIEDFNGTITELGGTELPPQANIEELKAVVESALTDALTKKADAEAALATARSNKDTLSGQILAVNNALSFSTYFTEDERTLLEAYRLDGYWDYEYATQTDGMGSGEAQNQAVILYEAAKSQLELINTPTVEVSADMREFVFVKDYEALTNALSVGRHRLDLGLFDDKYITLLLTGIDLGYNDGAFELTFANRVYKPDNRSLYDDLFGEISRSTNAISREKTNVYPVVGPRLNALQSASRNALRITLEQAISADNQSVTLDDTGYLGTASEDGVISGEQVKITNNSIVFTRDNWETATTAIGPIQRASGDTFYGINAQTVMGRLVAGVAMQIGGEDTQLGTLLDNMDEQVEAVNGDVGSQSQWLTFDETRGLIIGERVANAEGVAFYSVQTGAEYKLCSTISPGVPIVQIRARDAAMTARSLEVRNRLCLGDCEWVASSSGLAVKWRG